MSSDSTARNHANVKLEIRIGRSAGQRVWPDMARRELNLHILSGRELQGLRWFQNYALYVVRKIFYRHHRGSDHSSRMYDHFIGIRNLYRA
jgi:hypothetical protein